jgi:hypothetical protein
LNGPFLEKYIFGGEAPTGAFIDGLSHGCHNSREELVELMLKKVVDFLKKGYA